MKYSKMILFKIFIIALLTFQFGLVNAQGVDTVLRNCIVTMNWEMALQTNMNQGKLPVMVNDEARKIFKLNNYRVGLNEVVFVNGKENIADLLNIKRCSRGFILCASLSVDSIGDDVVNATINMGYIEVTKHFLRRKSFFFAVNDFFKLRYKSSTDDMDVTYIGI